MTQVFISYAREDYKTAKRLYDDLKRNGVNPWMDKENILIGQKWRVSIRQAIKECTHFLALISNNSLTKRGYVQKELKLAWDILDELPQSGVFILPILLEPCDPVDERLQELNWGELYTSYDDCLTQILRVLRPDQVVRKKPARNQLKPPEHSTTNRIETLTRKYELRNEPLTVSDEEAEKVFNLDQSMRPLKYINNEFNDNADGTVTDHATGLMWQKSGSQNSLTYEEAQEYIEQLNRERFAGHSDWRLPTIPELMSLLTPQKQTNGLYIDPIFDADQSWCWSADKGSSGSAWLVGFSYGFVSWYDLNFSYYVRGVRS